MRRSKELIVLVVLLAGTVAFILWYVVDRRARQAANPPAEKPLVGPVAPTRASDKSTGGDAPVPAVSGEIDLELTKGKTLDLSGGRPVIKDSPEDRAAMEAALKEMEEAAKEVTFDEPKAAPPKK